jgi:hypothetical protein
LSLRSGAVFLDRIGYLRRLHAANLCHRRASLVIDWYRVLARYLMHELEVLRDKDLSAYLRDCIFDLAYLLRQQGQYREALRFYRLSLRLWGWEVRTLKGVAKLVPHWARHIITARHAGERQPAHG